MSIECAYEKMGGFVQDRGVLMKQLHAASSEECGAKCDSKNDCGSMVFCNQNTKIIGNNCYLHKKELVGSEPVADSPKCFSYYKKCFLGTIINR